MTTISSKPRLRRWEAVAYLEEVHGIPTTVSTLAKWACLGGGPSFQKLGRTVLYPAAELDVWATSRLSGTKRHTSDPGTLAIGGISCPTRSRVIGSIVRFRDQRDPLSRSSRKAPSTSDVISVRRSISGLKRDQHGWDPEDSSLAPLNTGFGASGNA